MLVLSARADDTGRVALLEAGAQDYVVKPFAAAELLARVDSLLETKRARDVLRGELASSRTDVAALAEDLALRARQLSEALAGARAAQREAERAGTVKSNVLSLVSHELRTPITSMQLQIEILRRTSRSPTPGSKGRRSA